YGDRSDSEQCEKRSNEVGPIEQPENHAVTRPHTVIAERTGDLDHFIRELRKCDDGTAGVDRRRRPATEREVRIEQFVAGIERLGIREFRQVVYLIGPEIPWWIREHCYRATVAATG